MAIEYRAEVQFVVFVGKPPVPLNFKEDGLVPKEVIELIPEDWYRAVNIRDTMSEVGQDPAVTAAAIDELVQEQVSKVQQEYQEALAAMREEMKAEMAALAATNAPDAPPTTAAPDAPPTTEAPGGAKAAPEGKKSAIKQSNNLL